MTDRTCSTCAHWKPTSAAKAFGECRRFPAVPIPFQDEDGDTAIAGNKWLLVGADEWCGEHRGKN